jgi:tetratricopeptide (TPR) repeat protein
MSALSFALCVWPCPFVRMNACSRKLLEQEAALARFSEYKASQGASNTSTSHAVDSVGANVGCSAASAESTAESADVSPCTGLPLTPQREPSAASDDSYVFVGSAPASATQQLAPASVDTEHCEQWRKKGNDAHKAGKLEEAIEMWSKALEFDPSDARCYNNCALAYSRMGSHEDSLKAAHQAVVLAPHSPNSIACKSYYFRALAYTALGKKLEAAADFDKAKVLDPNVHASTPPPQPAQPSLMSPQTASVSTTSRQTSDVRPKIDSERSEPCSEASGVSTTSSFVHVTTPGAEQRTDSGTLAESVSKQLMTPIAELPQTIEVSSDGATMTRFRVKECKGGSTCESDGTTLQAKQANAVPQSVHAKAQCDSSPTTANDGHGQSAPRGGDTAAAAAEDSNVDASRAEAAIEEAGNGEGHTKPGNHQASKGAEPCQEIRAKTQSGTQVGLHLVPTTGM